MMPATEASILGALDRIETRILQDPNSNTLLKSPFGIGLTMFLSSARKDPIRFLANVKGFQTLLSDFVNDSEGGA